MKASENKVEEFLSLNKTQFVIPIYQRNYDWSKTECKKLLDDILEVSTSEQTSPHFIGSIVYVHDSAYTTQRIKEFVVIDGQQRLTTLTLIYLVLYRLAKELNDENLVDEIAETYLINKFATETDNLKLHLTENNDKALKYLFRSDTKEEFSDFSKLIDNFNYFKGRITEENYQLVQKGLSQLMFVEISLDKDKDNPQRIFESLNSTGLELSQADLIRNYILMGLNRKDIGIIYRDYWEIIEKLAQDETKNVTKLSDFIRDYLTLENKSIPTKKKVYETFKAKYPQPSMEELESNLSKIKNLAKYYNKLINFTKENDEDIRFQLQNINRLEINVAYPFLMQVYDDYANSIIDKSTFIEILELIQSFTWRRFIVGLGTNSLNKVFMNLYDKVDSSNYLFSIQKSLLEKSVTQRFPKDAEVVDALKVKDVYNIQSKNKVYLLERLENYDNNELVSIIDNPKITVEHIFPQNPNRQWKIDLEESEYIYIKDNYLHTIANLTLSGNNGKLGNKSFLEKRDLKSVGYKDSRLWLNKYLSQVEKWD